MKSLLIALCFITLPFKIYAFNESVFRNSSISLGIPTTQMNKVISYIKNNPQTVTNSAYVTFIDYRKPSTDKRGFLIQTDTGQVYRFHVAHGMNSGVLFATQFSNALNSHQTSLGLYVVNDAYVGKHGLSFRTDGLEHTNSNALVRDIVIHSADYMEPQFIASNGYAGRSWGCFAVSQSTLNTLSYKIRNGSLLLAFR